MKAYIFQPAYSMDFADSDALLQWELDQLDSCGEDADLIVLPEYSNVPCLAKTREQMEESYHKYSDKLLTKAADTARRCSATVFVNCIYPTLTGCEVELLEALGTHFPMTERECSDMYGDIPFEKFIPQA